jgi:uncharacterized protein
VAAGGLGGAVNAAAGGGSLLTFPALMAAGLPALTANVTNTVALCFGYASGAASFRDQLEGDHPRARRLAAAAFVGAVGGVLLLAASSPQTFEALVPWLLIIACALLAAQPLLTRRLAARRTAPRTNGRPSILELGQVLAGAYGAYFGAGMGLMVLAMLGISTGDPLNRLNALKAVVVLVVNVTAAVCFVLVAPIAWWAVAVLGPASLVGGHAGAALAKRLSANVLRAGVITIGLVVAVREFT